MKKSIHWGFALLSLGLGLGSCDSSTSSESTEITNTETNTGTTGNTGNTGTTSGPVSGTVQVVSSPGGDIIVDSAVITMVPATKGDTVVFTTNGIDPVATDEVYAKAFTITGSTTIKAAVRKGTSIGKVSTRSITITSKLYKPYFSTVRVDTFNLPQVVKVTPANEVTDTVYYTMGVKPGSPTRSNSRSQGSINVTQSAYLVARSFSGRNEPSEPETTQVVLKVAKLVPSAKSGNMNNVFRLSFQSETPSASIRVTRNGTLPNCETSELLKSDSLLVDSNQTITAIGCRDGWTASDTTKVAYKFRVGKLTTTPDSGIHETLPELAFQTATPGATVFYTTDSTLPTWDPATLNPTGSRTFRWRTGDAKVPVRQSFWLRAVAVKSGWINSDTMTARYVYIGDSALIDDFEQSGLASKYGEKGLSWFACQYLNGDGCDQDQKFLLDRTLPRLDTTAADWKRVLGFRAWRVQAKINKFGEGFHAGYAGSSIRVPEGYPGNAYRLVFWAKWQNASGTGPASLPLVVELALNKNSNNNGGYTDGFHRNVTTVGTTWKQYEIEFTQFYGAGNGYKPALAQPESTSTEPKAPARFYMDSSMHALGLSGWQGEVGHNRFAPAWTWDVSKDEGFNKGEVTAFRFSVMQPMTPAVAATVGPASPSWMDPHENPFNQTQLDALVKGIDGYLWIDNVRLVRKSVR